MTYHITWIVVIWLTFNVAFVVAAATQRDDA